MEERKSRARVLQKSVRYPTYQLYAIANATNTSAEEQLVIGALSVLDWLRKKFSDFDIPEEFQAAQPEEYKTVGLHELRNGHIEAGYDVEVISLPDDKLWAFRLKEPDLSTIWENGEEISCAVPGRIFETNIAFAVSDNRLHVGVKVIVSEPENTKRPCRVLRPAVVQRLAENPDFGLRNRFPIRTSVWELDSVDKIKKLSDFLRDSIMPAVVFCDYFKQTSSTTLASVSNSPTTILPSITLPQIGNPFPQISVGASLQSKANNAFSEGAKEVYNTADFAGGRMGYVQSFHLKKDAFEKFEKVLQLHVEPGDVFFMEPREFGGARQVFHYSANNSDKVYSELMEQSRDYLRKKAVDYGKVVFLTEAKLQYISKLMDNHGDAEQAIELYENRIALMNSQHQDQIEKKNEKIIEQANKITRLRAQIENHYSQIEETKALASQEVAKAEKENETLRERLDYYISLQDRPKTPQEIPEWVKSRFEGRLIFHDRAIKLISAVGPNELDMKLLCDALEYLATEYRNQRTGTMSREEANTKSAGKYGRPFEVTPCGTTAVEMSNDYKIKYKIGHLGKPVETPLDLHLKVGKTNGNLIRIYFLYDDKEKIIVVGSLPDHLKTAKIKG